MDFALVNALRLTLADVKMLIDSLFLYYEYGPQKKSLKSFAAGLAELMKQEAVNDNISGDMLSSSRRFGDNSGSSTAVNLATVLWDFFHGVILKFSLEELSQYPFWMAKVATILDESNGPLLSTFLGKLQSNYINMGLAGLYVGSGPYLAASLIIHSSELEKCVREFLMAIMSTIPRSASMIWNKSVEQLSSLANSLVNPPENSKKRRGSGSHKKPIDEMKPKAPVKTFPSVLERVVTACLIHPFLALSLRMVMIHDLFATPEWSYASTYYALFTDLAGGGKGLLLPVLGLLKSLTIGGRATILFSMLPWWPTSLAGLGIVETVLYRCMLEQGDPEDKSTGGAMSVLRSVVTKHGVSSLGKYGVLTALQIVPGAVVFYSMEVLLWAVFGSTAQRKRQKIRRRQILSSFWASHGHGDKASRGNSSVTSSDYSGNHSMPRSVSFSKET